MLYRFTVSAVVAFWLFGQIQAQTADEIVEKNIEAKGGHEKWNLVQTARVTGKLSLGQGLEAPFVWEWKRPNKLRLEFTMQGMTGVQAYDGATGWMIMPFLGKSTPEEMSEEDLKSVDDLADFEGPLMDYKQKGHQLELLGQETVEGTNAFKLKLTKKNGDVSYLYLDTEYFLEFREEGSRMIRGQEFEFETSIGDYKSVEGLLLPHSLEVKRKGAASSQSFTFDKVELNIDLADSQFEMPAAMTAESPHSSSP